MRLAFSYLKATKHASLFFGWDVYGTDEEGNPVGLYVRHIKNKPNPDLTYFEARDVVSELVFLEEFGYTLVLLDETFVPESYRKDWEYDIDHPRNLAKTVTVL